MTPKIFATMKEEQAKLDTQIMDLMERQDRIKEEIDQASRNRKAIADFLVNYEPVGSTPQAPNSNGQHKTRTTYGPTAETLAFLKTIYPSWATPTQIKENLTSSGMKKSSDLTVRMQKAGLVETRPAEGGVRGFLYRLKLNGSSIDKEDQ